MAFTMKRVRHALLATAVAAGCCACAPSSVREPETPPANPPAPVAAPPASPRAPAKPPVAPAPAVAKSQGEIDFEHAVQAYDDGDYKAAAKQFQSALDAGVPARDQANAHKYLAFIDCVSGKQKTCRDEFRKAFALDPEFDLAPAEAGHPVWGRVFRSVKAEVAAKSKKK